MIAGTYVITFFVKDHCAEKYLIVPLKKRPLYEKRNGAFDVNTFLRPTANYMKLFCFGEVSTEGGHATGICTFQKTCRTSKRRSPVRLQPTFVFTYKAKYQFLQPVGDQMIDILIFELPGAAIYYHSIPPAFHISSNGLLIFTSCSLATCK